MNDIFISYANADRDRVQPLVDALAGRGWSVWWDRKIRPGKTWDQVIETALDDAHCVVVVWTTNSIQSDWVRAEADKARRRGVLVPVLLDPVDIPLGFSRIQAASLVDWRGATSSAAFEELVQAVAEVLQKPPMAAATPPDHQLAPPTNGLTPSQERPTPAADRPLRRLARSTGVALLLTVLVLLLEYYGWLAGPEGKVMDVVGRLSAATGGDMIPVLTVEVDDDAYRGCFQSVSPLDPVKVIALVQALAKTNARTVGVDILTESEPGYRKAPSILGEQMRKIVWIAGALEPKVTPVSFPGWLGGGREEFVVKPTPVLGRDAGELQRQDVWWGLPVFPRDQDLRLRLLPQQIGASAAPQSSIVSDTVPSFARRVAEVACEACVKSKDPAQPIYVLYGGVPPAAYHATDLLNCSGEDLRPASLWPEFSQRANHAVILLGGTFGESRDFYDTPMGRLPGVIINAFAVAAELSGGTVLHEEWRPWSVLVDLLTGMSVVLIFWESERRARGLNPLRLRTPVQWSGAAALLICVTACWLLGPQYLPGMLGVGLGVLAHQCVEIWRANPRAPARSG